VDATAVSEQPLSPQELREMIAKSKDAEDDDCLMCGS
jgi:ribonucleoside-diphosphate reductase alpha chain